MKRFFIIFLLSVTVLYGSQNDHIKYGIPGRVGPILYREGYVLSHDNSKKVPLWVSYHLTTQHLQGVQERVNKFKADPELPVGGRAELSDYKKSGYDRGHMAPAGDMKRSYKVMIESFYLSNMCPQAPSLNRGLWKTLEEKIRDFARTKGEVWIICGPVFKDLDGDGEGDYLERIGTNHVWFPTHFYKIIVFHDVNKAINAVAFIMPNEALYKNLISYVTTIDSIELLTALDFLCELPDDIEEKIESRKTDNISFWITTPKSPTKSKPAVKVSPKKETSKKEDRITIIYHGNRKSKVFHKPGCRYYNCKNCTVTFRSRQTALNAGYRPCRICKP